MIGISVTTAGHESIPTVWELASHGPSSAPVWGLVALAVKVGTIVANDERRAWHARPLSLRSLTTRLLWNLGFHFAWIWMFIRIIAFVTAILPALIMYTYVYFATPYILHNIEFGVNPRNLLDIYLPHKLKWPGTRKSLPVWEDEHADGLESGSRTPGTKRKYPVVIFVSGGAWVIGYKAWGAVVGIVLRAFGVLTVMPDYRNYPQGDIEDMMTDVSTAIEWTFLNIHKYGGDPTNIHLVGQSAGCNLISLALIRQVKIQTKMMSLAQARGQALEHEQLPFTWKPCSIRSFIGISGPYDTEHLVDHLDHRGLPRSILQNIFEDDYKKFSPTQIVSSDSFTKQCAKEFPPVMLCHGTNDLTCPVKQSQDFARALESKGIQVSTHFYKGKSHTDPIIEDPMRDDVSMIFDMLELIMGPNSKAAADDDDCKGDDDADRDRASEYDKLMESRKVPSRYYKDHPVLRLRLPRFVIRVASWVNPF